VRFFDPDGNWPWSVTIRSFIAAHTAGGGRFYGDGRGASFAGTSRVTSNFTVDPTRGYVSKPNAQSDPTVFYGAGSLPPMAEKGSPNASISNAKQSGSAVSFDFSHSGKDPITPGLLTPALDVHAGLKFSEDLKKGILSITGSFKGDIFPSTEAFITDQSGKNKLFLGANMEKGGVGDLFGDNKMNLFNVNMQVGIDKSGNFTGVTQNGTNYSVGDWNKRVQDNFNNK